jgi:hypothetical protein
MGGTCGQEEVGTLGKPLTCGGKMRGVIRVEGQPDDIRTKGIELELQTLVMGHSNINIS